MSSGWDTAGKKQYQDMLSDGSSIAADLSKQQQVNTSCRRGESRELLPRYCRYNTIGLFGRGKERDLSTTTVTGGRAR